MSEGAAVGGAKPRLRIKGHAASVLRFFSISVAFMVLWILVTSQLGHYSKLFGPQILLQLNLAFYLPSIPVLLLSGSLERALDERLGPIGSIALRLNSGLGGCLVLSALFPLLPGLRPGDGPLWPLLTVVAILGGLSAVAFSTSYQFVQFFRAADTIGLGVGCVGAGPLVLLVQLALEVGPSPAKWQWIAMYEISAGLIAAGLLSSLSLVGQYWDLLNESASRGAAAAAAADGCGSADATDADADAGRVPLLAADLSSTADDGGSGVAIAGQDVSYRGSGRGSGSGRGMYGSPVSPGGFSGGGGMRPMGSGGLRVRRGRTHLLRPTVAPDPSNVFTLLSPGPDGRLGWAADEDDDLAPPVLLRRSMSVVERGAAARVAARRREALVAAGLDSNVRKNSGIGPVAPLILSHAHRAAKANPPPPSPELLNPAVTSNASPAAAAAPLPPPPPPGVPVTPLMAAQPPSLLTGMASAPPAVGGLRGEVPYGGTGAGTSSAAGNGKGDDSGGGGLQFGVPDSVPLVQPAGSTDLPPLPLASLASEGSSGVLASPHLPYGISSGVGVAGGESSFATPAASAVLSRSLFAPEVVYSPSASGIETPTADAAGAGRTASGTASGPAAVEVVEAAVVKVDVTVAQQVVVMTVQQEVAEVVRAAWQVLLGFLVSVTILYIVFPFFTYVPTSGWLGDSLPQVLFYARLFTDLAGRLLPRLRVLQLRSGAAVLTLAALSTALAALFFIYILAPASWGQRAPGLLRNDVVPVVLVVVLWLAGGYTNTISNMLAPALVVPELAGRASAVMALLFNVAHIGGLVIAAAMAAGIFGDVVG